MTDSRRAEARHLRIDPGLSLAQLRRHFGVGNETLTEWLRGVAPPEWTRRPNAKDVQRERALELRAEGWSVNDLAVEVGVAKSTAYQWVKHLPLDPDTRRAQEKRDHAVRMTAGRWQAHRVERDSRQQQVHVTASEDVGRLSQRDLLLLGAAIYWCEGSKSKPWRRSERLIFINTDPVLLGLFLGFAEAAGFERAALKYRVHIHETADPAAAGDWWAARLRLPRDRFRQPTVKRHAPATKRHNTGDDYHGCLVIEVPESRKLYWRVEGVMAALGRMT